MKDYQLYNMVLRVAVLRDSETAESDTWRSLQDEECSEMFWS